MTVSVFEAVVEKNMRRAAAPPQVKQIERLRETLGGQADELTVKPSSDLEAETLNALLDSVKYGFDASAVIQAQRYVNTNNAAAREMTTLVQLAYGGQPDKFTVAFKSDLAEQIYYAPTPAMNIYQDFRQLDWQRTVESFAPAVNNLAERCQIEIKPPGGDGDRNKLLADFVTRQLVEAYESCHDPLENYVIREINRTALRISGLEVVQAQKNAIADLTEENLKPPEFSSSLETSAYKLTKQDAVAKTAQAVNVADVMRETVQKRAERQMQEEERQNVRVLRM